MVGLVGGIIDDICSYVKINVLSYQHVAETKKEQQNKMNSNIFLSFSTQKSEIWLLLLKEHRIIHSIDPPCPYRIGDHYFHTYYVKDAAW